MKRLSQIRASVSRGFTLIEVMIVLVITVIGFMAVVYLQSSLLQGTANSWDVTNASQLARHTLETIRLEAIEWYNNTGVGTGGALQPKFNYLNNVGAPIAGGSSGWLRAPYANTAQAFQMVNQLGDNLGWEGSISWDEGALGEVRNDAGRRFCVQYRLTWLVPDHLIRAEVRVMWPRSGVNSSLFDACPADMFDHPTDILSVTIPMTVMKNVFVSP